jgi:hypothetical protein
VLSILEAGLDQQPLATRNEDDWQLPLHDNLRGPQYYH